MEHPNIARIIDKGVTGSGWPYLVMDYIDGAPFHKYCIDRKLAPPEIVRLMLECCRAVQYIHSHLVLHCDLKPNNILIDTGGAPRILDFGIARLIEPDRKTRGGQTTRGIRPLTPDYASPEQFAGTPLTVSTDIYSLGVVLYESLTKTLPFDHSDYPSPQIVNRLSDQDPDPPSKARSNRSSPEDAAFARELRGDLDRIVAKTLAFDPQQRYVSIEEFSDDLNRYLAGDAVKARRFPTIHQVSRRLKRRKRGLSELLAVCLAIALGFGLSSWYAKGRQRDRETRYTNELRAILNSLVVTLPEQLPESARARANLAERVAGTIESVSPAVSQYGDLAPDLANALLRTAEMFGNPYVVSLGREDQARAYYRRAFDLMQGRAGVRCAEIRARAALGIGDTYSHPALSRDPQIAAEWYHRALTGMSLQSAELRTSAALAHGRMGMLYELLGDTETARAHFEEGLALLPRTTEPKLPLESAFNLLQRAGMEPAAVQGATYREATVSLDQVLRAHPRMIRAWHQAIEAHLSLGLAQLQSARLLDAEREFAGAAGMAKQVLSRDADDLQERRELGVALRRGALIATRTGNPAISNALRDESTVALRLGMSAPAGRGEDDQSSPPCSESSEQFIAGASPSPLRPGDVLIANRRAGSVRGMLLAFSPASQEMNVLAAGGYLSDMADVAIASRTQIYVIDRSFSGSGGIVRLRHHRGRWLQKPVTCGGLLRNPAALVFDKNQLILADADAYSVRLIGVDPETGRQTLLGRTSVFGQPGKIVQPAAGVYYVSLFWPGEGGPAEVVSFNPPTRKFSVAARYGLLEDPVALAIAPNGDLIVGDREWTGNGGMGAILRISKDRSGPARGQKIVCQKPELSRVTAVAVASEREAWYSTAAVPYSSSAAARPKLFKLDLITGNTAEITISDGILAAPSALVRVD